MHVCAWLTRQPHWQTAVGKDFNRNMLALHRRINPKESIVGWYVPESALCCLAARTNAVGCSL